MQSAGRSHIYGSHDHGKLVTAIEQQAAEVVEILSEDEMLPKDRSGGCGAVQAPSRLEIGCRFVKQTPSSQFARFPALIEMFSHLGGKNRGGGRRGCAGPFTKGSALCVEFSLQVMLFSVSHTYSVE